MSLHLKDRMYMLTPEVLMGGIKNSIEQFAAEYPQVASNPVVLHDFILWGLKKAFTNITGYHVDSFDSNDKLCNELYQKFKFDFEHYMFAVVTDIGSNQLTATHRYNLVLTYERLYLITF